MCDETVKTFPTPLWLKVLGMPSAVVLSGGPAKRMGCDKGLLTLAGKPLIWHVCSKVSDLVDEVLVVVSDQGQAEAYTEALNGVEGDVRVLVDEMDVRSPLVGAVTGFRCSRGAYTLLTSSDMPLIPLEVYTFLLDLAEGHGAVAFRWPDGRVEPLPAVYRTVDALKVGEASIDRGDLRLRRLLTDMRGVLYVSTRVLKTMDPEMLSLFDIDSAEDLRRAESIVRRHPRHLRA